MTLKFELYYCINDNNDDTINSIFLILKLHITLIVFNTDVN